MSCREIYRIPELQLNSSAGNGSYLRTQPYRSKFKGEAFCTELPVLPLANRRLKRKGNPICQVTCLVAGSPILASSARMGSTLPWPTLFPGNS